MNNVDHENTNTQFPATDKRPAGGQTVVGGGSGSLQGVNRWEEHEMEQ